MPKRFSTSTVGDSSYRYAYSCCYRELCHLFIGVSWYLKETIHSNHCKSWLLCWCIGLMHLSPWGKVRCSNLSCDTTKTWKQEVISYHQTFSHWLWMSLEDDVSQWSGLLIFLALLWHSVTFSYEWSLVLKSPGELNLV